MTKPDYVVLFLLILGCCLPSTAGTIIERRDVKGFNAIDSTGPFVTTVEITGTEGLIIEADLNDKNATDLLQTVIDGNSLKIFFLFPYDQDDGRFAGQNNMQQ